MIRFGTVVLLRAASSVLF